MFSQPDYIKINGLSADRHPNLDEEERNADDDGRPFDATFHGTLSKAVSELLREFSKGHLIRLIRTFDLLVLM